MPGMPPGAPPGMPGMPPPPGGPGQGPNPAMGALQRLGGMPMEAKEKKALAEASAHIQIALAGIYGRSAKAADHLSKAYSEIQKCREVLEQLGSAPVGPPPDLLGGLQAAPMGPPSPMI